jgi:hypothetical protein
MTKPPKPGAGRDKTVDYIDSLATQLKVVSEAYDKSVERNIALEDEIARLRAALQSITLYPIQYDAPLTNDDLWDIISEMQGMAAGAIVAHKGRRARIGPRA